MKCILLIRVSTERQSFDSQTQEVKKRALYDGYKEEDIIIIEDKESAVKLSEAERKGLNKMKAFIEADKEINCIYVWEISRISRRMKDIFSIRDYLKEKKVQLVIIKEGIKIFDVKKDFALDSIANIVFSIMGSFAESEAETLKERARRGKEYKRNLGKFIGGNKLFGYNVIDKNIVINEDEAKVVKLIFNLYCIKKYNCYDIVDYLNSNGFKTNNGALFNEGKVSKILREKRYIGETKGFPQIIIKSMFESASLKRETNKWHTKYKNNNIYFGSKLLFSLKDGKALVMSPQISDCSYSCKANGMSININVIDSLLWAAAKAYRRLKLNSNVEKDKIIERINEEINNKKSQVDNLLNNNEECQDRIDKIEIRLNKGKISEKAAEKLESSYVKDIETNNRLVEKLKTEIEGLRNDILELDQVRNEKSEELDLIRSDVDKKRIIDEEIGRVEIVRIYRGKYRVLIKFGQRIVKGIKEYIVISNSKQKLIYQEYVENQEEIREYNEKILKGEEAKKPQKKIGLELMNIKIEERIKKAN